MPFPDPLRRLIFWAGVTGLLLFLAQSVAYVLPDSLYGLRFRFPEVHDGFFPALLANGHGWLGIVALLGMAFFALRKPSPARLGLLLVGLILIATGWHREDSWLYPLEKLLPVFQRKELLFSLHLSAGVFLVLYLFPEAPWRGKKYLALAGILGVFPFPHGAPRDFFLAPYPEERHGHEKGSLQEELLEDWGCRLCHSEIREPPSQPTQVGEGLRTLHELHTQSPCVTCHRGAGRALFPTIAHGEARFFVREPLLKGPWVQSSCTGCHRTPPPAAELLALGDHLWKERGCAGCHLDPEERLAPYLPRIVGARGMAPLSPLGKELEREQGYPPFAAFLAEAIVDPRSHLELPLSPQAMPVSMPVFSYAPRELTAITLKVLSLKPWRYPQELSAPPPQEPPPSGAEIFRDPEKGCIACHTFQGEGGELGPPLDPWKGKDPEALVRLLTDPHRKPVPGYPDLMPRDYGVRLSRKEQEALAEFLTQREFPGGRK